MEQNEILMIHGTNYKAMTKQLLKTANLEALIGSKDKKIGLKPNLVVAKPASFGATTHPELLAGTIEYLQDHGFKDITVMEGSWVGEDTARAFNACGYGAVLRKYNVRFLDLKQDSYKEYDGAGMKLKVCDAPASLDFMINMPVLKGHCQTTITCALKNNKGVIPDSEKRRYHTMGLHKSIAHLNTIARNDFILVDNICGDLDFEEGGSPVVMNRIPGFRDPVLCDAFVCEAMGYRSNDVDYVVLAERLGVGSRDTKNTVVTKINESVMEDKPFPMTGRVKRLAAFTKPKDACSACYGSLIYALDRLSDKGMLHKGMKPVSIGQGYKGEKGAVGIGSCTRCFDKSLAGCPPKAVEIAEFLEEEWVKIRYHMNIYKILYMKIF